jgi:hypothetical protein
VYKHKLAAQFFSLQKKCREADFDRFEIIALVF